LDLPRPALGDLCAFLGEQDGCALVPFVGPVTGESECAHGYEMAEWVWFGVITIGRKMMFFFG
jgi:hypothetical protein